MEQLVDRAERVLQAEHANWIEEMQAAVTRTQDDQGTGRTPEGAEGPIPGDEPAVDDSKPET